MCVLCTVCHFDLLAKLLIPVIHFIAYCILNDKMIITNLDECTEYWQTQYHLRVGDVLCEWNINTTNDTEMKQEIVNEYKKAIKLRPNNAVVRKHYGQRLEDMKEYKLAIGQYRSAFELNPQNGFLLYFIGRCHLKEDDNKNAEKYLKWAIDVQPNTSFLIFKYAQFLRSNMKDYHNARIFWVFCWKISCK